MTSLTWAFRQRTKKKEKTQRKKRTRRHRLTILQKKRPSRVTDGQLIRKYRNPKEPGSLGGVSRFAKAQEISVERAKRVLSREVGYTLHKPTRRRFPTLRVTVFGPDEQWAADLVDVQKLKRYNRGANYLLTVMDVFSKYAWVLPVKRKTGPEMSKTIKALFASSKRHPQALQTDDGKEFYNKQVAKLLKEKGVCHFSTAGDTKASTVERFNRTFKQRLYRYMTTFNTLKYLPVLQSLVRGYNASFHRSIGMAPKDVSMDNAAVVWETLYGKKCNAAKRNRKAAFVVGDRVRLNQKHRPFQKGYTPGWTEEVFVITRVRRDGNVDVYTVSEWDDTPIKGTFYTEDLQKVSVADDDLFRIESVVRHRKDRLLVRWKGWPAKYDSWVDKKDLVRLT